MFRMLISNNYVLQVKTNIKWNANRKLKSKKLITFY